MVEHGPIRFSSSRLGPSLGGRYSPVPIAVQWASAMIVCASPRHVGDNLSRVAVVELLGRWERPVWVGTPGLGAGGRRIHRIRKMADLDKFFTGNIAEKLTYVRLL